MEKPARNNRRRLTVPFKGYNPWVDWSLGILFRHFPSSFSRLTPLLRAQKQFFTPASKTPAILDEKCQKNKNRKVSCKSSGHRHNRENKAQKHAAYR
jgi:hypothetical protein